jgi:predicted esterase
MNRRRWGALCAVLVAIAGIAGVSGYRDARATTSPSLAAPLIGPATAGSAATVDGTYVWTDYAYDDDAAKYPNGLTNAADLVQLQLTPTPDGVRITALLETLLDPTVPRLLVGFDTDRNAATGAPALPDGGWVTSTSLGLEQLVVITHDGANDFAWDGASWALTGSSDAIVDTDANTVAATVPLHPGGATWNAVAALGVSDAVIRDLAFVGGELPSGWQSAHQNAVLAGTASALDAVAPIDFAALAAHTNSPSTDATPGFHTRLYRSALDLGEGIGAAPITAPGGNVVGLPSLYAGPYQPYLVWVADDVPDPAPIIVYMHGFGGTHTSSTSSFGAGAFNPHAIAVMPLGRGQDTFYFGAAEQDVLDATDDALAHYQADADRVVLSGVSMGGFGTYRIGVRYPDRWSALVPFIGTGGSPQYEFGAIPADVRNRIFSPTGFPTGNAELLENIGNIPIRMINGQVDPLVNNVLVTQDAARLDELGYDYRSWVLLRRHHEVVPSLSSCVFDDVLQRVRDREPAHVVLSVEPELTMQDAATGLDLRYDHAYWVSEVAVADGIEKGTVDALSLARADRDRASARVLDVGQNLTAGTDLCGPNPAVQTNDAWRMNGIALTTGAPAAVSNGARVTLTGITSASLDLDAMHLVTDAPITITATSDRSAALHLRSGTRHIVVSIGPGTNTYTVG